MHEEIKDLARVPENDDKLFAQASSLIDEIEIKSNKIEGALTHLQKFIKELSVHSELHLLEIESRQTVHPIQAPENTAHDSSYPNELCEIKNKAEEAKKQKPGLFGKAKAINTLQDIAVLQSDFNIKMWDYYIQLVKDMRSLANSTASLTMLGLTNAAFTRAIIKQLKYKLKEDISKTANKEFIEVIKTLEKQADFHNQLDRMKDDLSRLKQNEVVIANSLSTLNKQLQENRDIQNQEFRENEIAFKRIIDSLVNERKLRTQENETVTANIKTFEAKMGSLETHISSLERQNQNLMGERKWVLTSGLLLFIISLTALLFSILL